MRGALISAFPWLSDTGIIPTDAGSTTIPVRLPACGWDHPRGCGEHEINDTLKSTVEGSSPRMRGALEQLEGELHAAGIIPADAGST